jgi:light-regulated signal transduction histidine kinase (bacteriophytochrome)
MISSYRKGVPMNRSQRKSANRQLVRQNAELIREVLELRHANRELEAFCHAISHDLRTSLTRIYSSGQALLEYRAALDPDGLFFVNAINDGSQHMEAMLDALMALSKVTEVELVRAEVDLSRLTVQQARELQLAEPDRQVSFRVAPQLRVQGDPQLLPIALDNLLRNAWKYTSRVAEAVIELGSLQSPGGETVYYLKDNGAGFDNALNDLLFKPFQRLHSIQEFPGAGLGLATVRRIIRRHNGRIWGEGKPGCGATFYFTVNG